MKFQTIVLLDLEVDVRQEHIDCGVRGEFEELTKIAKLPPVLAIQAAALAAGHDCVVVENPEDIDCVVVLVNGDFTVHFTNEDWWGEEAYAPCQSFLKDWWAGEEVYPFKFRLRTEIDHRSSLSWYTGSGTNEVKFKKGRITGLVKGHEGRIVRF